MARIFRIFQHLCIGVAAALLVVKFAQAQTLSATNPASAAIPQTVEDALHQMSDKADVIFVGQVTAIRPPDGDAIASGAVEVDFRIDQAIRGCVAGQYALREWAGLWSGNAYRYRVGQRLLMILRAPGPSGMSSPVGGMDGAIPIRGGGVAPLPGTTSSLVPVPIADLRWLGAKLMHPVSYPLRTVQSPTPLTVSQQLAPAAAVNSLGESIADPAMIDDSSSRASVPMQQASVETVTRLLGSWQKAPTDVR